MTRPREDPPPAPSLRHNPFAALRGPGAAPSSSLASTPSRSDVDALAAAAGRASVVVRREKKGRGGKAVTIAEGAGLVGRDLNELARAAAKALGTGARVEGGALVVQGEQVERVAAFLASRGLTDVVRGN
jgi:translation initiation factor 1 (eIF-1/SUI1)